MSNALAIAPTPEPTERGSKVTRDPTPPAACLRLGNLKTYQLQCQSVDNRIETLLLSSSATAIITAPPPHHKFLHLHLHPNPLPSQIPQRPSGMAYLPSPAARPARSHTPSSTAEPSTHHHLHQPHQPPYQPQQPSSPPHPRPHSDPKAKFTLDDDALLSELKEQHEMTWKQIAGFFPGRSSGTLQVRYCTKLKAKGGAWTDELVGRLRQALHEYESERWRVVSGRVGHGFSAAACKLKAEELELAALAA